MMTYWIWAVSGSFAVPSNGSELNSRARVPSERQPAAATGITAMQRARTRRMKDILVPKIIREVSQIPATEISVNPQTGRNDLGERSGAVSFHSFHTHPMKRNR